LGECDVSVNNSLPLTNSELLRSYSLLSDTVRPMVLLVKAWAKHYRVCGAHEGNLSSYSWTIMVIYYLQLAEGLPSLQMLWDKDKGQEDKEEDEKEKRTVFDTDYWGYDREFDASFVTAERYFEKFAGEAPPKSEYSMGELLYGFFRFYAREYRWGSEIISIRNPAREAPDGWWRLYGKIHPEDGIHVEDPIELRDLNIVLKRHRLAQLKAELGRASSMMEEGCSLEELMSGPCLEPAADMIFQPRRRQQRMRISRQLRPRAPRLYQIPLG